LIQKKSIQSSFNHSNRQGLLPLKAGIGSELIHFFWHKHLELIRNKVVALQNQGVLLALMNIALIMLAVDLLAHELKISALPLFWA
tara:strand:- start:266 stop:523 length:258 start_codon:yes stop_codon:yes gene_type:complete